MSSRTSRASGYTIVELLIIIAVIAILSVLTFIMYAAIQERARMSSAQTAIASAIRKINIYTAINGSYPPTLAAAEITNNGGTTYGYEFAPDASPAYYCITATVDQSASYFVTSKVEKPVAGSCIQLEAWWPFNSDDTDFSQSGREPSQNSGTDSTGQNSASGSLQFGVGNGFVVPSVDGGVLQDVSYGADWSIAAWVQSTGPSDNEAVIVGRVGCNGGLYTNNGNYQFALKTSNGNCWDGSAGLNGIPIDDKWHHLAGVYQGGTMRFYVDGRLAASGFVARIYGYSTTLRIGGTGTRVFNGKVDDVRIYSRAMTPGEITYVFRGGAY